MRGKAADPCRFCDSQEWHKITIGFSESILTGIYRRSPYAQTRLNEIARPIRGNLLLRISKKGNNGVRAARRGYILRAYTTGNIWASDKNAGWTLEFRYRGLSRVSLLNIFFITIQQLSPSLHFLIFSVTMEKFYCASCLSALNDHNFEWLPFVKVSCLFLNMQNVSRQSPIFSLELFKSIFCQLKSRMHFQKIARNKIIYVDVQKLRQKPKSIERRLWASISKFAFI